MSNKTEEPTPKRLREAREQGDMPRSPAFSASVAAIATFAAVAASLPASAARLASYFRAALASAPAVGAPGPALAGAVREIASASAAPLGAALVGAMLGAALQVGLVLSPQVLSFKLDRLDVAAGLKRLVSVRKLGDVLRSLAAFAVAAGIAWAACRDAGRTLARLPQASTARAWAGALDLVSSAVFRAGAALLALAALDVLFQRWSWRRGKRMSPDEVRREHKESEGDPHQKAKRKAQHRALLAASPARGVPRASVVVVNPTHVAVALRYAPREHDAPTVVAKGRGARAAELRRLAERYRIPLVRDIPLARALHGACELGDEIPEELYEAAAAVLRKVLELSGPEPDDERRPR